MRYDNEYVNADNSVNGIFRIAASNINTLHVPIMKTSFFVGEKLNGRG